jgi:predicted negative regulator of RcsB-dependent stress response
MKNDKLDKVYLIVFLILEFIVIFIYKYFDISDIKIFIIIQIVFVILFSVLYFVITLFIEKLASRKFCIEYNKIMREYQKTDDAKIFYDKLKNMKEKPIGYEIQNTYFLSLATAAYKNGESEEALKYLDMIKTDDEHILKVIEDERKTIMGEDK